MTKQQSSLTLSISHGDNWILSDVQSLPHAPDAVPTEEDTKRVIGAGPTILHFPGFNSEFCLRMRILIDKGQHDFVFTRVLSPVRESIS
jgi:hypothetical protein